MRSIIAYIFSPLHEEASVERVVEGVEARFAALFDEGCAISSEEEAEKIARAGYGLVCAAVITGGTEHLILKLAESAPTIILAHERMNSLPAALEAVSALKARGATAWLIPSWEEDAEQGVRAILRGVSAARELENHKMGLIGGASPWLVYSKVEFNTVEKRMGVKVVEVSIDEVLSDLEPNAQDMKLAEELIESARSAEVSMEEAARAATLYRRLRELIDLHSLNSLTIKCFDMISRARTTACLALSLLLKEGIVAGCEGDLPTTLSMLIGKLLSGRSPFMGNPAVIGEDELLLAHCTVSMDLIDRFSLKTHFESGLGVGVEGEFRKGEAVTVMRLSADLRKLRAGVGRILDGTPRREGYCRTQILIGLRGARKILKEPMGNHYVVVFGDIMEELQAFCAVKGIAFERI